MKVEIGRLRDELRDLKRDQATQAWHTQQLFESVNRTLCDILTALAYLQAISGVKR